MIEADGIHRQRYRSKKRLDFRIENLNSRVLRSYFFVKSFGNIQRERDVLRFGATRFPFFYRCNYRLQ